MFASTSGCWNLAVLSAIAPVAPLGPWTLRAGIAIGGALTLFSIIDVFRLGVYARLGVVRARRQAWFTDAVTHYLKGDYPAARRLLDRLLDLDPADPVARLYLATLERRAGSPERAIHHARRALAAAPHADFAPEIEREIVLAREVREARRRDG